MHTVQVATHRDRVSRLICSSLLLLGRPEPDRNEIRGCGSAAGTGHAACMMHARGNGGVGRGAGARATLPTMRVTRPLTANRGVADAACRTQGCAEIKRGCTEIAHHKQAAAGVGM